MKKLFIVLLVLPNLSSCYSFNKIVLPENGAYQPATKLSEGMIDGLVEKVATNPQVRSPSRPLVADVDTKSELVCPPYLMPNLEKTPELPLKELMKIDPNNIEALDKIQSQHISDLRDYITKIKTDIRNSHNDYIKKCYASSNQRPPN